MFFHQFWDSCIHEHQFSYNVCNIDLVGNLIACVHVLLYLWPVRVDIEEVKEVFKIAEDKIPDIVWFGRYLFLVIVDHDLFGQTYLISFFSVRSHDEDESNDGSNQPSNIGEVGIKFIECPFVFVDLGWFPKGYFSIGQRSSFQIGIRNQNVRGVSDSFGLELLVRQKTDISLDGVLLDYQQRSWFQVEN